MSEEDFGKVRMLDETDLYLLQLRNGEDFIKVLCRVPDKEAAERYIKAFGDGRKFAKGFGEHVFMHSEVLSFAIQFASKTEMERSAFQDGFQNPTGKLEVRK